MVSRTQHLNSKLPYSRALTKFWRLYCRCQILVSENGQKNEFLYNLQEFRNQIYKQFARLPSFVYHLCSSFIVRGELKNNEYRFFRLFGLTQFGIEPATLRKKKMKMLNFRQVFECSKPNWVTPILSAEFWKCPSKLRQNIVLQIQCNDFCLQIFAQILIPLGFFKGPFLKSRQTKCKVPFS